MGKLHIERSDFGILERLTENRLSVTDDRIECDMGGSKIALDHLETTGCLERNGVRIELKIRMSNGSLEIDFQ